MTTQNSYYDLDKALADLDAEPIRVKVRGRKLEFRPQISTYLVLRLVRMTEAGTDEGLDNVETLMDFWRHLFGDENFKVLTEDLGLSIREMTALQQYLLSQYGVTDDGQQEEALDTGANPQ